MPEWAQFLIRIGWWAGTPRGAARVSGVLVLPVSTYAPALVALGALLARFVSDPWSSSDSEEHARLLDELEEGVAVSYRSLARVYKGVYRGRRDDGRYRVQVEAEPYRRTFCIERARALDIQPIPGATTKLPKSQVGKEASSNSLFRELLGAAGYALLLSARTEVALVGSRARLQREFEGLSARLRRGALTMQQLIRVREFRGTDGHFAAQWFSAKASNSVVDGATSLVLFTSSRDFLKAAAASNGRNALIVTDTADERIDEALASLEEALRAHNGITIEVPDVSQPPGLRMWTYEYASA